MWIPKEKWQQGQEILDWVDIGETKKDIWVSIPDEMKGEQHEVINKRNREAIPSPLCQ